MLDAVRVLGLPSEAGTTRALACKQAVGRLCLLLSLICWLSSAALQAQPSGADPKKRSRDLLAQGHYTEAKALLSSQRDLLRSDKEARFLLAVCNYHLNLLDEAFEQLKAMGESDRYPFPECRLYLGKIHHARHEFAEAGRQYKKYLKTLSASNPLRRAVSNEVRRCQNGLDWQYKSAAAFVENLGPEVNTPGDEFGPVPSPTYMDRLYFSSIRQGNNGGKRDERGNPDDINGHYTSDMYSCRLSGGKWSQTQPLPYHLNSPRHEVLADISPLGNVLFYFKGTTLQSGEILVDTFRQGGAVALTSDPFISPLNPATGEVSFHLFNDTLLIFSSNRAGGYGGFDLYRSSWRNGRWSAPENLGPQINSAFDETTPYLLRDGRTLFFSSNNIAGSIGGQDIFKSVWDIRQKRWSTPENLGLPINSAADDTHFRVSKDGFTAFLASSRKDGFGRRDLYAVYFNDFIELDPVAGYEAPALPPPPAVAPPPPAAAVSNSVSVTVVLPAAESSPTVGAPSRPAAASNLVCLGVERIKTDPERFAAQIQAAAAYLRSHPGQKVTLTVFSSQSTPPGQGLFAAIRSAEAVSAQLQRQGIAAARIFVRAAPAAWNDAQAGMQVLTMRFMPPVGQEAPPPQTLRQVVPNASYPTALEAPVCFKVQVASLKGEYTGPLLDKHPDPMVEKIHGVDFYRYTVGAFNTWAEAEQFRRKLQAQGQSSAFITAYLHGYRIERATARDYVVDFPELKNFAGN